MLEQKLNSEQKDETQLPSSPNNDNTHVGRSLFAYLEVKEFSSGKVIKRMDLRGKSIRDIDKIEAGLNRNLNHEKYYTFYWDSEKKFDTI